MSEPEVLAAGSAVEVLNRFERQWSRGFDVAAVVEGGYTVKRRSDGAVLPAVFSVGAVRAETAAPVLA